MVPSIDWIRWGLLLIAATLEIIGDPALLLRRAELAVILALWVGVAAVLLAFAGWSFFDEALSLRELVGLALVVGGMILLPRYQFTDLLIRVRRRR